MGIITKKIKVLRYGRQDELVEALFDTGASFSLVRSDIAKRLGEPRRIPKCRQIKLGDGKSTMEICETVDLDVEIEGHQMSELFYVSDVLVDEMVIGVPIMQAHGITLYPKRHRIRVDPPEFEYVLI